MRTSGPHLTGAEQPGTKHGISRALPPSLPERGAARRYDLGVQPPLPGTRPNPGRPEPEWCVPSPSSGPTQTGHNRPQSGAVKWKTDFLLSSISNTILRRISFPL